MQQGYKGSCSLKLAPNDVSAQLFSSLLFFLFISLFLDLKSRVGLSELERRRRIMYFCRFLLSSGCLVPQGLNPPPTPSPQTSPPTASCPLYYPSAPSPCPLGNVRAGFLGPPLARKKVCQVSQSQAISGRAH